MCGHRVDYAQPILELDIGSSGTGIRRARGHQLFHQRSRNGGLSPLVEFAMPTFHQCLFGERQCPLGIEQQLPPAPPRRLHSRVPRTRRRVAYTGTYLQCGRRARTIKEGPGGEDQAEQRKERGHVWETTFLLHGIHPMPPVTPPSVATASALSPTAWRARERAHLERVQQWTEPRRARRARKESHPVYDFLFQYYSYSAGKLETWHPAPHELLLDTPEARERFDGPEYLAAGGVVRRCESALSPGDREKLQEMLRVMIATRDRPANFGCYGMHEWAMVFGGYDVRHASIAPLRLPQDQVDAFVQSRPVACSHFDAFRFFAPNAKPMNRVHLAWATRHDTEQPGCVHANMDLYRWAYTAMPWVGSDLLWRCFTLATELRVLDMQAGPYDLQSMGFEPVRVETPEGRDEYQRRQRELAAQAAVLRDALIEIVGAIANRAR